MNITTMGLFIPWVEIGSKDRPTIPGGNTMFSSFGTLVSPENHEAIY